MSSENIWDGPEGTEYFNVIDPSSYSPIFLSRADVDRILSDGPVLPAHSISLDGVGSSSVSNSGSNHNAREHVNASDLEDGSEQRCTFMLRKFPRFLTSEQFMAMMSSTGLLDDAYDMLYVPIFSAGTKKTHNGNRGYAFINFKNPALGALFVNILRYSPEGELGRHLRNCEIVFAHVQGKIEMLSHFVFSRNEGNNSSVPPGLIII